MMRTSGWQVSPWGVALAVPGEKLVIGQGEAVHVLVCFNYRWLGQEPARATVHGFIGTRQADGTFASVADGKSPLSLAPATEFTPVETSVDIDTGGVFSKAPPGTYDLFMRIDEYPDANAELCQCIEIAAGAGLSEMMLPLMLMMMFVLVMPSLAEAVEE